MHAVVAAIQAHPKWALAWLVVFSAVMFVGGWGTCSYLRDRAEGRFADDPLELGGNSDDPEQRVTVAIKADTRQFDEAAAKALEGVRRLGAATAVQRQEPPWADEGDWATAVHHDLPDPAKPAVIAVDPAGEPPTVAIAQQGDRGETKFWTAPIDLGVENPFFARHETDLRREPPAWATRGHPLGSTAVFTPGSFTGAQGTLGPLPPQEKPALPSVADWGAAKQVTAAALLAAASPPAPEPAPRKAPEVSGDLGAAWECGWTPGGVGVPEDPAADFDALIEAVR